MLINLIKQRLFGKTWDYQYENLEYTPILHDAKQLRVMYQNAQTDRQKACIINHIVRFQVNHKDYKAYLDLYNTIYDEYR